MSNCRLAKAQGRSGKLAKLKMQSPAKQAQIAGTGVFTAATFGHQCQGFAPKRMKVLRAIAGNHYGKLSFGSLDLLFDLSETGTGDPLFKLVLEHWKMLQECVERDKPAAGLIRRTWEVTWNKLTRSKQRWSVAAGPIAAMQCYLADMGFDAHSMSEWTRPGCTIALPWGQPGEDKPQESSYMLLCCRTGGSVSPPKKMRKAHRTAWIGRSQGKCSKSQPRNVCSPLV